jgi:hypothetical protein
MTGCGPVWHLLFPIMRTCLCYLCNDDCTVLVMIDKPIMLSLESFYLPDCYWLFDHDLSMRTTNNEGSEQFLIGPYTKGWYLVYHINHIIVFNE